MNSTAPPIGPAMRGSPMPAMSRGAAAVGCPASSAEAELVAEAGVKIAGQRKSWSFLTISDHDVPDIANAGMPTTHANMINARPATPTDDCISAAPPCAERTSWLSSCEVRMIARSGDSGQQQFTPPPPGQRGLLAANPGREEGDSPIFVNTKIGTVPKPHRCVRILSPSTINSCSIAWNCSGEMWEDVCRSILRKYSISGGSQG